MRRETEAWSQRTRRYKASTHKREGQRRKEGAGWIIYIYVCECVYVCMQTGWIARLVREEEIRGKAGGQRDWRGKCSVAE